MDTVIVSIKVRPEQVEAFKAASLENCAASRREPGVARFDVLQDADDACHFLLYEAYRDAEAPVRHKESAHYKKWKELCEPMMAEPRSRASYRLFDIA